MKMSVLLILAIVLVAYSTAQGKDADKCYSAGEAYAGAYFSTIDKAVEAGVTTSQMMNRACKKEGQYSAQCERECVRGFKAESKYWLKNGKLSIQ